MALTALIIDDEPLARQELQYLLDRAGDVTVLAQGSNGIEAVDLIRTYRPDVVFLDVRMPGLDGFAVLKKLMALDRRARLPQVVFATAFDQYAVKAFEVNAVDYLLKPFDSKRVVKTLEKVRARAAETRDIATEAYEQAPTHEPMQSRSKGESHTTKRHHATVHQRVDAGAARNRIWDAAEAKLDALLRMVEEQAAAIGQRVTHPGSAAEEGTESRRSGKVVIKAQSRLLLVDQRDVCFASIDEGRITVVTKTIEGESNVRTLEELMDQVDPDQFWRAHRSFVVNIEHIREVVPWFKSSYQLRMDDRKNTEIPVSRSQTRRLRELFNLLTVMSEARERQIIQWIVRCILALFVIALLIYPADWAIWQAQRLFGGGMGSVDVSHVTVAEVKGNKDEYYPDGVQTLACSRSLFPEGGNDACWWLRRHPQVIERY